MAFITLQSATYDALLHALKVLRTTGENTFDCSLDGTRVWPILFGSSKSTEAESHYHSFVGEVTTGRWEIPENRVYFWVTHVYWGYDMKIVYKILTYDRPVHILRCWAQELLAYTFTYVHCPNSMLHDLDTLSC